LELLPCLWNHSFFPVESLNVFFLIELLGPSYRRTETIHANSPPLIVGRDPSVAIHIPDPDRSLSRKHLSLDCTESGVRVSVLSTVNGISTPHGEIQAGQQVILLPGESAQMGMFTLRIIDPVGAGSVRPAASELLHPDPFAGFSGAKTPHLSVFDNAFFRPALPPEAPTRPEHDIFASLGPSTAPRNFSAGPPMPAPDIAMSALPNSGGVFAGDPLAAFASAQVSPAAPHRSIDDFLRGGSSGGLGASSMLLPLANPDARKLAVDHVHDFNLPVSATLSQEQPLPAPSSSYAGGAPSEAVMSAGSAGNLTAAPLGAPTVVTPSDPAVKSWPEFSSDWLNPQAPQHTLAAPVAAGMSEPFSDDPHEEAQDPFSDEWSPISGWQPAPEASAVLTDATLLSYTATTPLPGGAVSGLDEALAALCKGLGVEGPSHLDVLKWEQMGEAIRIIVQGLTELMNTRAEIKRELRATDRTMLKSQDNNPLKSGMAQEEILQYLLFNPTGIGGYMKVDKALNEAINDLRAHEFASIAAVRAAVEGTVRDFEPVKMRATLTKGKSKLPQFLDNARLWEMYTAHYQTKATHMADWLEQLFNYYFMPVYLKESERLRSEQKRRIEP
jgi:type VI secretion system FHA domain protein